MNIFASYWFWGTIVLFLAGWYLWHLLGRISSGRMISGFASREVGFEYRRLEKPATLDGNPHSAHEQQHQQGRQRHGGCC